MELFLIILFSLLGTAGAISLAATFLFLHKDVRQSLIPLLVSYATGTILGAAFLVLLPEVLERLPPSVAFGVVLGGIIGLFFLEKLILMRHCHDGRCERHAVAGTLILLGDSVHSFVDGVSIAAAFLISIPLGIATGLAAVAHEVPQEVGDFAVLLDSGFHRSKAFLYNILSGIPGLIGGVAGYLLLESIQNAIPYILALAAASFLYVGMADLVPHLHERPGVRYGFHQVLLMLAGVGTIFLVRFITHP